MRAAILMSLFVVCAALSMHYLVIATGQPDRSDPLVALDQTLPQDDEGPHLLDADRQMGNAVLFAD